MSGPHLVVAQSKIKVGHLTAYNHIVWRLDGVSVLPFSRSDSHLRNEQNEAADEQRKMVNFTSNSQCGNLRNFLSFRFYVKSILMIFELEKQPFLHF